MNSNDPRQQLILQTAQRWLGTEQLKLTMIAGDASFRRYFRVRVDQQSWVVMDAPPEKENCNAFLAVTKRLRDAGLHAPVIFQTDLDNGLLLLEDLGDIQYKPLITKTSADHCFSPLFASLKTFAHCVDTDGLPAYSARLLQKEMDLFPDWYLNQHKKSPFNIHEQLSWEKLCADLVDNARLQPQTFVHRDFHSCNLLKTTENDPGIIDYQDAVLGPVSYDLVSLLWDRYISWPRNKITAWCEQYRIQLNLDLSGSQWQRHCDLMSLQRNLKIVGIFARLHYRDNKPGYLEMIPRFWDYCIDTLGRYPEYKDCLHALRKAGRSPE